jgi:glucose-6-phosphate dehydrogenase assembly protein OpcA
LKKLWEQDDVGATRASLMNLAIYCEGRDAMAENTALISDITQTHACRAILVAIEPEAPESHVHAWISAHCHMGRAGGKQVCCEQITFLMEGHSCGLIPNIVFSHLDSDLPLCLWWQAEFSSEMDEQLWAWVDRLVFDSQIWSNPSEQFALLRDSLAKTKPPRLILCDLNWTRLIDWRQGVAEMFDSPACLSHLCEIKGGSISHSPGHRTTALLLIGWMMAQLGWKVESKDKGGFQLAKVDGSGSLRFDVREDAEHPVDKLQLWTDAAKFQISHEKGSSFLHEEIHLPGGQDYHHLVPPGKDNLLDLFNEEMLRGGKHKVYVRALAAAETLF